MFELNLPPFEANIVNKDNIPQIFDILRMRYVKLTPEEWVRQHWVHYLLDKLGYPRTLMANELTIQLNGMSRRCDTVLLRRGDLKPQMILEYKAPTVSITSKVFAQIGAYNVALHDVPYLVVSNGLMHYVMKYSEEIGHYEFLTSVPAYSDI